MNNKSFFVLLCFVVTCASCSSRRIESVYDKQKLISLGMTPAQVESAIGKPSEETDYRKGDGVTGWRYDEIVTRDPFKMRALSVKFKDGKVSAIHVIE